MSTIETILERMMNDPAFADAVFADAEKALTDYNLSVEDLTKFRNLSRAQFDTMSTEERKSFFVIIGNNEKPVHKGGG